MKAAGYPYTLTIGSHRLGTGGCTRQYACPHAWDIGVLCLLIAYMMGSVLGRKFLVLNLLDIRGAKHFCLLSLLIICCNLFHTLVYFMISTCFILDFSCYFYIFIVPFWLINSNVPNYKWKRLIHSSNLNAKIGMHFFSKLKN